MISANERAVKEIKKAAIESDLNVVQTVAKTLGLTERGARNRLNCVTETSVEELAILARKLNMSDAQLLHVFGR